MSTNVTLQQVGQRLKAPPEVVRALAMSGLLGYWDKTGVPQIGVEQFERYGTQWRSELGQRNLGPEPFRELPVSADILGGEQPPGTGTEVHIVPSGLPLRLADQDTGWIAQFYLRPNTFFFANPEELAPIGPIGIRLAKPLQVAGAELPCYLYPDGACQRF